MKSSNGLVDHAQLEAFAAAAIDCEQKRLVERQGGIEVLDRFRVLALGRVGLAASEDRDRTFRSASIAFVARSRPWQRRPS